jgi:hypothetical protein
MQAGFVRAVSDHTPDQLAAYHAELAEPVNSSPTRNADNHDPL